MNKHIEMLQDSQLDVVVGGTTGSAPSNNLLSILFGAVGAGLSAGLSASGGTGAQVITGLSVFFIALSGGGPNYTAERAQVS